MFGSRGIVDRVVCGEFKYPRGVSHVVGSQGDTREGGRARRNGVLFEKGGM